MIVEDTPDLREFLVKNFEDIYDVLSAKNGAEALAILEKQACDLIISDALMPEMDGFNLLMKVRNDEMLCHIPFILLSVIDSVDSKIKGRWRVCSRTGNGLSATLRRGRIFSMKKMTWGAMTGNG